MMIKNNNLFRVSSLNILTSLNLLHVHHTHRNIARGKKNQMSRPDPSAGLIHMATVGEISVLSIRIPALWIPKE